MDRKSVSAVALIVAASAFYPRAASRNATPNPSSVGGASAAAPLTQSVPESTEGPGKPICDHFRLRPDQGASAQSIKINIDAKDGAKRLTAEIHGNAESGKPEPLSEQYCLQLPEAKRVTFRTMIVLAPDPELTHLSLDFDRTMESIIWAVTDGDFTFESYWFPWQEPPDKEETDPDKRKAMKQDQEDRLQKPGMLLFRGQDAQKPELLAVFVVGDRPDFGPSRTQFQAAIDAIHILPKDPNYWLSDDVSIVGPSFSGSIEPLGRLIENDHCDRFFVVTGRATSQDAIVNFPANDTIPRSLCATVENDKTALNGFGEYALTSGLRLGGKVAILNEDETVYGRTPNSKLDAVQLRFPRGISRLRNSVQELPGLNSQTSSSATGYQALPLMLKEPGADTIRSYSEQLTPISSEAVLLNIGVSLRRMQIRYAGILATDPLDMLFLARFLRIAAPDIQLFLLESDALFAREAHNWNLEGVVTITNYPLVLENQYGKSPTSKISFASGYEEATYNACRRALFRWTGIDSSPGCDATNPRYLPNNTLVGYQSPFPNKSKYPRMPALWVTVLGHDSFWPVALLNSEGSTLLKGPPPEDPRKPFDEGPEPFIWRALFLSLMAFNVAHLIFAGFNLKRIRNYTIFKALLRYDPVRNFRIRPGSLFTGGQAASIVIMLISLALVNAIFFIPALTFHWWGGWLCGVFLMIFVVEAIWMTRLAVKHRESWSGAPLLAAIPWGFAVVSVVCLVLLWKGSKSHASFFFVYRSVHLDNGVSPAAPLLALAVGFYYWAWIQTRRFRLADELRPEMPETVIAPRNFMGELHGVFGKKGALLFALLNIIFFLIFCPFIYVRTVEGRAYDYFVATALLAIYAMLIGSLVRFSILWRDLRIILQFLERHPLRDAFSRLPHTFSWTSIWSGDLKPTYLPLTRSRDCLRRLYPSFDVQVDRRVKTIEDAQANNKFQFQPKYFWAYRSLQRAFKRSADSIAFSLQLYWSEGSSDSIEEAKKTSLDPERMKAPEGADESLWFAEEFLALQYVALIRYVFFQMRNFLEFFTAGFILMVMAVYVYPFEDRLLLGAANITMFALLAIGMLIAFAQMDRDPVLSRLSATKPRLDMNFVLRVVSYGSLPVLALLGSQFPTVGNFLFSWVQPALQSMK